MASPAFFALARCQAESSRTGEEAAIKSKTQQIRDALAAGDQIGALRIAARYFDGSVDTKTFTRGIGTYNKPIIELIMHLSRREADDRSVYRSQLLLQELQLIALASLTSA
jgi:hypothetical protein